MLLAVRLCVLVLSPSTVSRAETTDAIAATEHAHRSRTHHTMHPVRHRARHPQSHIPVHHPKISGAAILPPPIRPPSNIGSNTGLPLPRFAALRADEVNMRSGPGLRYPIEWIYRRRELPVEIEREFDVWRLVEDSEGTRGWVHQATLVGTRSFVVTTAAVLTLHGEARGIASAMRTDPRDGADIVAILRPGVTGRLRSCPQAAGWCRVSTHGAAGWVKRSEIFGLLPNETITPP